MTLVGSISIPALSESVLVLAPDLFLHKNNLCNLDDLGKCFKVPV
jgi:hypothetical protein